MTVTYSRETAKVSARSHCFIVAEPNADKFLWLCDNCEYFIGAWGVCFHIHALPRISDFVVPLSNETGDTCNDFIARYTEYCIWSRSLLVVRDITGIPVYCNVVKPRYVTLVPARLFPHAN